MDKKLLILVDKMGTKTKLLTRLISEGMGSDVKVVPGIFSHLFIEVGENEVKIFIDDFDIKEFDLVYFRRIDHSLFPLSGTLALCLDKLGIKYFDTKFREIGAGGDKMTSLTKLFLNGVSVPKTIFCSSDGILSNGGNIISKLGLPIIVKNTVTQGNKGIFVIKKEEDFKRLLGGKNIKRDGKPTQFIFQEFINIDREYRVLVLKDRVAVVHTKVKRRYDKFVIDYENPDLNLEFVNSGSIPDSLKEIAIKAANVLNIEIAGVDVCLEEKTGKVIVLEVNRGPGFDYNAKTSPEIKEVTQFFKNEISKR